MSTEVTILDALAWAGTTEQARVAWISAKLVRSLQIWTNTHTKTDVKEAVKLTQPPYGRGKYIIEAVEKEYRRQLPIYRKRKEHHDWWQTYLKNAAARDTRLDNAYAAAFDRPQHLEAQGLDKPYSQSTWDERSEWDASESARDKGDQCVGLTHQGSYVVALLEIENGAMRWHIATRLHKGPIVRTYLRCNVNRLHDGKMNLVEAAVSLGGPKVKAALSRGKRVETDWVGRRTLIHHEGQDYVHAHIEEIPWRTAIFVERQGPFSSISYPIAVASITHGETVTELYDYPLLDWNDTD